MERAQQEMFSADAPSPNAAHVVASPLDWQQQRTARAGRVAVALQVQVKEGNGEGRRCHGSHEGHEACVAGE